MSLPIISLIPCDSRPSSLDKAGCQIVGLVFSNLSIDNRFPLSSKICSRFCDKLLRRRCYAARSLYDGTGL